MERTDAQRRGCWARSSSPRRWPDCPPAKRTRAACRKRWKKPRTRWTTTPEAGDGARRGSQSPRRLSNAPRSHRSCGSARRPVKRAASALEWRGLCGMACKTRRTPTPKRVIGEGSAIAATPDKICGALVGSGGCPWIEAASVGVLQRPTTRARAMRLIFMLDLRRAYRDPIRTHPDRTSMNPGFPPPESGRDRRTSQSNEPTSSPEAIDMKRLRRIDRTTTD